MAAACLPGRSTPRPREKPWSSTTPAKSKTTPTGTPAKPCPVSPKSQTGSGRPPSDRRSPMISLSPVRTRNGTVPNALPTRSIGLRVEDPSSPPESAALASKGNCAQQGGSSRRPERFHASDSGDPQCSHRRLTTPNTGRCVKVAVPWDGRRRNLRGSAPIPVTFRVAPDLISQTRPWAGP